MAFVVDVKGRRSHRIIQQAVRALLNLEHRGACGSEKNTGDGAGILSQIPHEFFKRECETIGFTIPSPTQYGVGMVFLPVGCEARSECEAALEAIVLDEGQRVLGWRTVPTNDRLIGPTARSSKPVVRQVFIGRGDGVFNDSAFERKLYVIRKRVETRLRRSDIDLASSFYISSLSYKTIVYKGMLTASQLTSFYPDLVNASFQSALALVHSRFSTNTFPSWARAHPYRYLAHNGEINTLRGNINWMHARESSFESSLFGSDLQKFLPVIDSDASDSGMFDNVLEMLTLAGRTLPHAMMMMIPEPWTGDRFMSEKKRAFYEYHSCLMEPWDGPAAVAFTDGFKIGAMLDRNGLRPARYLVTKDDLVVMASEAGVLDVPVDQIARRGRLQPGRMLLVDTEAGRIIDDAELKERLASEFPYRQWLDENMVRLEDLPEPPFVHQPNAATIKIRQRALGYTNEDLKLLISPMATHGHEAVGSMGTDTPVAILSTRPQLLYSYFKQLFAQVTNPPVDGIREEIIMSAETIVGPEFNILEPTPQSARQIRLSSPILTNRELEQLRLLGDSDGPWGKPKLKSITLQMLFEAACGGTALAEAMDDLCRQASAAIASGYDLIVLSDRNLNARLAPIPALLAVSGVHHHLIREGTRTRVGLLIESGEPREIHHFALLLGYGAAAINPYLVFETISEMVDTGSIKDSTVDGAQRNYVEAAKKGIIKVISKMGISTTQGYCGAQVFEALGLNEEFIDKYFARTPSRIGGVGIEVIAEEVRLRHTAGFEPPASLALESGGQYQFRQDGELHLFRPQTIHKLQYACRTGDYDAFKEYSEEVSSRSRTLYTLRGLMDFSASRSPVPIDEVEPIDSIMRRFKTGAMSYGSISREAHETIAIAMNRIGGKSNTGEGGEDANRFIIDSDGDSRNSAIKQVASGRFGVTSHYLVNAREIQIKIAQGAKPGEGGQLAGHKVYPWIAQVRHTTPGVGLISPPPHHDIYSIEDLAQLIFDLKNANRDARISVKLVAEIGVGTIAAGVAKAGADVILISGYDGGTGAAPLTSIKHAGVPWELGLAETQQTLLLNDLRSRVTLETDGQLKTGRDVVIAALLGAEEFGFATAPLVAIGCIMMRACHLNTCPVGVATQDPELRRRFKGEPQHLINFMRFLACEVRELMASLGFRTFGEMVGKVDALRPVEVDHWKAKWLDLSNILFQPNVSPSVGRSCRQVQEDRTVYTMDRRLLLDVCTPALERGDPISATMNIKNTDRSVGTMLGSEVTKQYGPAGLPHDTIRLKFIGSAGQSFGAFVPKGITLTVEGESNDYIGKGLCGGKIIVMPPSNAAFNAEENVIVGNVAFYGATSGEAYIHGAAGERFCVRNSGAHIVVQSIGDHGCEYMTGGRVVVLGPTGRNFAAGMSGGIAYIVDESTNFTDRCNLSMVTLTSLDDTEEIEFIKNMIFRHAEYTGSRRATDILLNWDDFLPRIVRVIPHDYKRVLEAKMKVKDLRLSDEEAAMAVFELNSLEESRRGN